jgi:hypothetical protein
MSHGRAYAFLPVVVAAAVLPAHAQSIIATHSGVVHYFDGAVFLDGKALESHLGKFTSVPQGSELRTAKGHAEVLLTPGVFLRLGDQSTIRLVANDLADTRVELQTGSAIVDAGEANPDTSVTLIYKDWRVHILAKGVYRLDTDPPHVSVPQGEAEVFAGTSKEPVAVNAGMTMPLAEVLVPERSGERSEDALNDWENGRSESIAADNAIAAQIDEDPASKSGDLDAFTYFPLIDVPYLGGGYANPYGYLNSYQPGFNSIYLPGYTYAPILLGLAGRGGGIYIPSPPLRIGGPLGSGGVLRYPYRPVPPASIPRTPVHIGPVHPVGPVHPAPAGGVHAVHR